MDKSFKAFFKGAGYPKYKSKKTSQVFYAYQAVSVEKSRLKFFGNRIKLKTSEDYSRILQGSHIRHVVFKKDLCGNYWASVIVYCHPPVTTSPIGSVGIDLGLNDLIITSDGVRYENKRHSKKASYNLTKWQRKFAKTIKGGKNRAKIKIKISKIYSKTTRQRNHYHHEVVNNIIRDNQTVVIETLRISNMVKNRNLARSISDASWNNLINILEYKASWHGRKLVRVGSFYPSSKTCSGCGKVKDSIALSERIYKCEGCALSIDRDLNAAINIRNAGLKIPGVPVEDTNNSSAYEAGSNSLIINN